MGYYMLLPDTSEAVVDKAAEYLKKNFPYLNDGWLYYYNKSKREAIDKLKRHGIPSLRWWEGDPFVCWGCSRSKHDVIHTLPMDNIFVGEL